MAGVVVVTDSTAYLPDGAAAALGVVVVPLQVVVDGRAFAEGVEISASAVTSALRSGQTVTTSRPSVGAMLEAYERVLAGGADAIVSVHLSGDMSGTVDAARSAAASAGLPVRVVDSRSMGMGLGFAVQAAARLAQEGGTADAVARLAEHRSTGASIYFYVDTLEFLRRGGRIGAATAWLGSALTIKPLLELNDGRLEPLDRVRTSDRAIARMVEIAAIDATKGPVEIAVHHLAAPARAQDVVARLGEQVPDLGEITVSEVGGVVGAHVGPGAVGVVVSPLG
jgi:DegV family protein with EDD domain